MNKLRTMLFFSIYFIAVVNVYGGDKEMNKDSYELFIELSDVEDLTVTLNLRNDSNYPLTFSKGVLSRQSIVLIISEANAFSKVLDEISELEAVKAGSIIIMPGGRENITFNLRSRFPKLVESLKKDNLILFWYADISLIDGSNPNSFGGHIKLSKIE